MISKVGRIKLRVLVDLSRKETCTEWTERHEANAKLFQGGQQFGLRPAPEEGIFALHGGHPLDRVRPANRLNASFGKAKMFDLPFGNQVFNGSRYVLNRHIRIDAMLIEEIDVIGSQPFQASVSHGLDMPRLAVGSRTPLAGFDIDVETELGGNHDLIANWLECFAHKLFVREWSVSFSCIEVCHT